MTSFFYFNCWGMDWGHLQLRGRWDAPPRLAWGIDKHRTVWHLIIGPFELSGHVRR